MGDGGTTVGADEDGEDASDEDEAASDPAVEGMPASVLASCSASLPMSVSMASALRLLPTAGSGDEDEEDEDADADEDEDEDEGVLDARRAGAGITERGALDTMCDSTAFWYACSCWYLLSQ